MKDEEDLEIPTGMVDVTDAISILHIISNMIGNSGNRGGNDVLERLQKLGFSDETSFYLLWYALCVVYQEVEDITAESFSIIQGMGGEIQEIFDRSEDFPSLSEALRTVVFMDDDSYFGEMKQSWKDHWKARYRKHWRKYLDNQDTSVPYFKEQKNNAKNTN